MRGRHNTIPDMRRRFSHPAAADGSVVNGRAGGRHVVGGGGVSQRPLGLLLGAVGVTVLDDVILSAEERDDGWSDEVGERKRE